MGKIGGFKEYTRNDESNISVPKRETNKKGENNEKEMIDVILFLFDRYI